MVSCTKFSPVGCVHIVLGCPYALQLQQLFWLVDSLFVLVGCLYGVQLLKLPVQLAASLLLVGRSYVIQFVLVALLSWLCCFPLCCVQLGTLVCAI